MNHTEAKVILASASPRRKLLMAEAGINFLVQATDIDESFPDTMDVRTVAQFLAVSKARALTTAADKAVVAADTTVLIEGRILNKPADEAEAVDMLQLLSGKMHEVITGVCIRYQGQEIAFSDVTKVYFRKLTSVEIEDYVKTNKPFDKAGAYGIQEKIGLIGIERIEGSYFNVMGLPIHRIYKELEKYGLV